MHIQIQRQVVSFQNQLESVCECAGAHRLSVRLTEQVVIFRYGFVRGLLDIYAHAFDKNKRKAQEKLGKAIGL